MNPLLLCLGLVIVAGLVLRVMLSRRRQVQALRRLAAERGLSFSDEDLIGIHDRYHNLDLLRQGHSRHVCHVLYGGADVGLVTVFCYSYELGFGGRRASRHWWFAIVETRGVHEHWCAVPVEASPPPGSVRIDRFQICADHEHTRRHLMDPAIESVFRAAPLDCRWEVRGALVAAAAPYDPAPRVPGRLLAAACDLARILADRTLDKT